MSLMLQKTDYSLICHIAELQNHFYFANVASDCLDQAYKKQTVIWTFLFLFIFVIILGPPLATVHLKTFNLKH